MNTVIVLSDGLPNIRGNLYHSKPLSFVIENNLELVVINIKGLDILVFLQEFF